MDSNKVRTEYVQRLLVLKVRVTKGPFERKTTNSLRGKIGSLATSVELGGRQKKQIYKSLETEVWQKCLETVRLFVARAMLPGRGRVTERY